MIIIWSNFDPQKNHIMNTSVVGLSLSRVIGAPLFINPKSPQRRHFSFSNIDISKSFSKFIYSSSQLSMKLTHSKFSNYHTSVVLMDSIFSKHYSEKNSIDLNDFENSLIDNCLFTYCNPTDKPLLDIVDTNFEIKGCTFYEIIKTDLTMVPCLLAFHGATSYAHPTGSQLTLSRNVFRKVIFPSITTSGTQQEFLNVGALVIHSNNTVIESCVFQNFIVDGGVEFVQVSPVLLSSTKEGYVRYINQSNVNCHSGFQLFECSITLSYSIFADNDCKFGCGFFYYESNKPNINDVLYYSTIPDQTMVPIGIHGNNDATATFERCTIYQLGPVTIYIARAFAIFKDSDFYLPENSFTNRRDNILGIDGCKFSVETQPHVPHGVEIDKQPTAGLNNGNDYTQMFSPSEFFTPLPGVLPVPFEEPNGTITTGIIATIFGILSLFYFVLILYVNSGSATARYVIGDIDRIDEESTEPCCPTIVKIFRKNDNNVSDVSGNFDDADDVDEKSDKKPTKAAPPPPAPVKEKPSKPPKKRKLADSSSSSGSSSSSFSYSYSGGGPVKAKKKNKKKRDSSASW